VKRDTDGRVILAVWCLIVVASLCEAAHMRRISRRLEAVEHVLGGSRLSKLERRLDVLEQWSAYRVWTNGAAVRIERVE
jgi:hypothetical protein